MMELVDSFASWAWARHHNPWSWYIRPLFLLPYVYFAWRRSGWAIAGTLVALATSMFWFPAPDVPDPRVEAFLAMEREWLTGTWDLAKVGFTLLVPVSLAALALAFWRRSVVAGVVLINLIAVTKVGWSVAYGGSSGWAVVPPALAGAALCNLGVWAAVRWRRRRESARA